LTAGLPIVELLAVKTAVFPSKGEARKMLQGGGVSVNQSKIMDTELVLNAENLIKDKYMLVQKGKKNYFVLKVS
jgi:tyrosyl-tRNA synthetase